MTLARDEFDLRLQFGRVLRGRPLALAVLLRETLLGLLFGGLSGSLAPAWIVVAERRTRRTAFRVFAGREPNAGRELLEHLCSDADVLSPDDFLRKWRS